MGIVPDYDYQKCRDNARDILKDYRRTARIVGAPLTNYKSPVISDMPVNTSYGNKIENRALATVDAKKEFELVNLALKKLKQIHFQVIYYTYLTSEEYSDVEIASLMFNSYNANKSVEAHRRNALIDFCEVYKGGKLLVFEQ